ncbi:hypothetical protein AWC38_SpisGene12652 [Stylophora pistillata]|uniref:Uncharacterized protein n=1 Tax=Stylophora pistillata TaxID=50429 RepID=A0A2B4S2V9_STYPI|nr:hypothetical protein AWC38_SpisGene12652 [Stylophora pistillata]
MVVTYTHMFDACTQDWFAVAYILENLLLTLKLENPSLSKAFIRSDEAGCYQNNLLIASIHGISQRTGVVIESYEFSEPQHGKDICDRIICPMKQAVQRYCDEGHDIQPAADMREALLERPVQGVTASVWEVNGTQRSIDVTKIPNFSAYHNFEFEPRGIRVRKAYSVGQDGRSSSFQSFESLQHYLNYGQHENKTSQESVYDQLRRDWVAMFTTVLPENRPRAESGVSSVSSSSLSYLWAGPFKSQELVEQGTPPK